MPHNSKGKKIIKGLEQNTIQPEQVSRYIDYAISELHRTSDKQPVLSRNIAGNLTGVHEEIVKKERAG